ncbi:MAG: alpha-amylase family glycosyl hydrolase [Chloroflexota bacterium]|nr:alpha-amylase family glycosyl hydrolase [Chloroflexota bacterium]
MSDGAPPAWVRDAVFYQIFPDRFARSERVTRPGPMEPWESPPTVHGFKGGDLYGIIERLDHIASLGVTALYLNPIFASASNHRFHTYDYYTVDPLLGGNDALRELLDEAHRRGMRVVLDGVFNHASRGFWPFHHVLETGRHSPYREWFYLDPSVLTKGRPLHAYPERSLSAALPADYGTTHREGPASIKTLGYQAWWNLPALPKLNVGNPQMREYLLGVAEHWIRFGADGWRLDVAAEIEDLTFWAEFRHRVRAVNPEAYLVAEIWDVSPEWLGPDRFDALMNYPLGFGILGFAAGSHLDRAVAGGHGAVAEGLLPLDGAGFATRVEELLTSYPAEHVAAQLNLLDSHDTPRALALCGEDEASLRIATLLQMAMPGAPSIYYGDEIGMTGHADPDSRRAFPPNEGDWNHGLLAFMRGAVAARAADPALRGDGYRTLVAGGAAVAFERTSDADRAIVGANAGEDPVELVLPGPFDAARLSSLLSTDERSAIISGTAEGGLVITLPARWGGIWQVTR